jgi:hypothetical protein
VKRENENGTAVHLKTLVVHNAISSHCRDAGSSMLVLIVKENEREQNM